MEGFNDNNEPGIDVVTNDDSKSNQAKGEIDDESLPLPTEAKNLLNRYVSPLRPKEFDICLMISAPLAIKTKKKVNKVYFGKDDKNPFGGNGKKLKNQRYAVN